MIDTPPQVARQRTLRDTADDVLTVMKTAAANRPQTVTNDIHCHPDGSYTRTYGKATEQTSADTVAFSIAVAVSIVDRTIPDGFGDSLDAPHVLAALNKLPAFNFKGAIGITNAKVVLGTIVGKDVKHQRPLLVDWLRIMNNSMKFVSNGGQAAADIRAANRAAKKAAQQPVAAAQTAPAPAQTIDANALKVLIDSGVAPAEAVALLR